jgi:hypothetical protein
MPCDDLVAPAWGGPLASGSHAVDFASWGPIEWVVYSTMALVCIWVLWRAVVTTVRPNEDAPDHVKRMILGDEAPPPPAAEVPLPPATRS